MDKKLNYSAEHYRERLSAYAKDTIEYQSLNGFIKYNINKHGNPVVVEEFSDHFKIHVSEKPKIRLVTYYPRSFDTRDIFFSKVHITNEDVLIEILWNKWQKVIYIGWILFVLGIGIISSLDSDFGFFLFLLPLLLISFFTIKIGRRRYKTFIINFLNTIAAS